MQILPHSTAEQNKILQRTITEYHNNISETYSEVIMFSKKSNSSETNFWISYADLMAGLLFVFILLIGAIVVKSSIVRNQLNVQNDVLSEQESTLDEQSDYLIDLSQSIAIKSGEITKLRNLLAKRDKSLEESQGNLLISNNSLKLKSNELSNLNQLLLAQNTKVDNYSEHIILLQNLTKEQNNTINNSSQLLESYKNKVIVLSSELTQKDASLKLDQRETFKTTPSC